VAGLSMGRLKSMQCCWISLMSPDCTPAEVDASVGYCAQM